MAFVVVTSLLELVEQQLLQPNPRLILDDRDMIVSLLDKFHFLQAFLEEFGTKTNDPDATEMLDAEIQDVATEVESKIAYKLRQVYLATNEGDCVVEACEELYQTLQQVLKDIELLEARIGRQKTKFASLVGSLTKYFKIENFLVGVSSQNALDPEDLPIIGLFREAELIVENLKNHWSLELEVFPLVGMGGLGKTTLAKRIYEHYSIRYHFHIRAWAVMSKEHNIKEMLIDLLHCILPVTSEISNKGEAELVEQLRSTLMGQRYLIVLDDVWTIETWDAIQRCFPDNFNGSRILITSRFSEVASYLCDNPFHLQPLNIIESWAMFSRMVYKKRCIPRYKYPRNFIARGCKGIPLAIVLIAGLLATVKESSKVWRDVAETLDRNRWKDPLPEIIPLCYNYLPNRLKTCFLYFGVFREDSNIPVKKLINLWVAEGFLKPEKNKSLEEVAKNYLHDLINRNLVQINKRGVDGKIKSCKIHDRVHEICVREAKKKNIMCLIDKNHAPEASRWISCQSSHWPITQASYGNHTSNKIRSVLYFGKDLCLSKCRLVYPCLKLLRVLDLSLLKYSYGLPSGIADLIHLRYLALSTIGSLYKFRLSKLQHLQTLIICSWMEGCHLNLASHILDLPQLRHLHLEKRSSQYLPSLVQENLRTFYWLKVACLDQKPNFGMVPNLKELGIYIEGELVPGCLESLVHLRLLEKLKLEMGRVERFYLPVDFPPNLKKLTLRYTYLSWKEMDMIGKLPNLEVLKLKDLAFCGPRWEPTKGGFKRLKVLLIARSDLKHWNASACHFRVLERLILRYCWDLKEVPFAFAKIGTLKLIVLESCYTSLADSAYYIKWRVLDEDPCRTIDVLDLGTKVELPSKYFSELPNYKVPKIVLICQRMKALKEKVLNCQLMKALKKKVLNCQEESVELPRRKC